MCLRSFAVRSLLALAVALVAEHGIHAQGPAQDGSVYTPVYTPTYVPVTPRSPNAALSLPNPITPFFRALLPAQANQQPGIQQVQAVAPMPNPIAPPAGVQPPGMMNPGVAPGTPVGPGMRPTEPLEEAADYVMGTLQLNWDDAAIRTTNWFDVDYQLSWLRAARTPPLVTSSGSSVPLAQAGVLGLNSTAILLGQNPWSVSPSSGFRMAAGQWLDDSFAIELGGFLLEDKAGLFHAGGDGSPTSFSVGRPFIDTSNHAEAAAVTAFPNAFSGTIDALSRAQMWGTEANVVFREEPGRFFQTKLRAGLRYLDLDETISIQENSTPLGKFSIPFNGAVIVTNPDSVRVIDTFRTHNQFIGPQVGFDTAWKLGRLNFLLDARVAIGGNHQVIDIGGTSETISGGRTTNLVQGGLLATSSNSGQFTRDTLSIVPEIELKMEYRFTPTVSAFVSYDFLAWSDVANPGDQIPRQVDLTRVPTSAVFGQPGGVNPGVSLSHGPFTSQSLHVGMVLKF
jgi:hypothetical protein